MIKKNYLSNEKNLIFVIGLGKSGFWAAKYLKSIGKRVIVWESKYNQELIETKKELEKIDIFVSLKKNFLFEELHPRIKEIEYVVVSPSIPYDHETILKLKKRGIKVIGEINIAWEFFKHTKWIGITGTNGKTTVTHLLSHILCKNDLFAPFAGNIGIPLCKFASSEKQVNIDWLVAELSSYQIEIAPEIKPKIGIWTTFTEDHLERHKTIENYFKIKNRLLEKAEYRIYNYDDVYLRKNYRFLSDGIWITTSFHKSAIKNCDYWIDDKEYIFERNERLFKPDNFILKGRHNIQNLLLAIAAARKVGLSAKNIKDALNSYQQLPHRLETIYKKNYLEIINDSKATNFDSSIAGINAIKGELLIISGGRLKGNQYGEWIKVLNKRAKAIFLFGESSEVLKKALIDGGFQKSIFQFRNITQVIDNIFTYLKKDQFITLLFSPACSSFDQFRNYEERGDFFKQLINEKFVMGSKVNYLETHL